MVALQVSVWNGLYTHLTGSSDFDTAVNGRIYYGYAPNQPQLPYAVVQFVDDVPYDTFSDDGYQTRVQVSIYGAEENGHRATMDIGDDLRARLHRQVFAVTDHEPMAAIYDQTRGPLMDDQLWRVDLDFILRGFRS